MGSQLIGKIILATRKCFLYNNEDVPSLKHHLGTRDKQTM